MKCVDNAVRDHASAAKETPSVDIYVNSDSTQDSINALSVL